MTLNLVMPCAEVLGNQETRNATMEYIRTHMYDVGANWRRHLSPSSLNYTSACGSRVVKIDNCKIVTIDDRINTGWKSQKFTCKTVEEAWKTLSQAIKVHDIKTARSKLH